MPGRSARHQWKGPLRLTANVSAQRLSSIPSIPSMPAVSPTPATFASTSAPPSSASIRRAASRTFALSATSHGVASATPPAAAMISAVWAAPAASRSTIATRAPSVASRTAVARPIPDAAPVTTATRSVNRLIDALLLVTPV